MSINLKHGEEKERKTVTENCITVPQDDVIIKICEGIYKLRNAVAQDPYMQNRLSVTVGKSETIRLDLPNGRPLPTRISQVLLFQFILCQFGKSDCNEIELDVTEYFALRGIARRKENLDVLYEDLLVLSCISLSLQKNIRGTSTLVVGALLEVIGYRYGNDEIPCQGRQHGKQLRGVVVRLRDWSDGVKRNQFVYLSIDAFNRNSKTQATAVMMSLKLGQLVRSNYKSFFTCNQRRYKISELLRFLGISDKDIHKQGYTYYLHMLKDMFLILNSEGYVIQLEAEGINSNREFNNSNIMYANPNLQEKYSTIKKTAS